MRASSKRGPDSRVPRAIHTRLELAPWPWQTRVEDVHLASRGPAAHAPNESAHGRLSTARSRSRPRWRCPRLGLAARLRVRYGGCTVRMVVRECNTRSSSVWELAEHMGSLCSQALRAAACLQHPLIVLLQCTRAHDRRALSTPRNDAISKYRACAWTGNKLLAACARRSAVDAACQRTLTMARSFSIHRPWISADTLNALRGCRPCSKTYAIARANASRPSCARSAAYRGTTPGHSPSPFPPHPFSRPARCLNHRLICPCGTRYVRCPRVQTRSALTKRDSRCQGRLISTFRTHTGP